MTKCNKCKRRIKGLPFRCRRCNKKYCHRCHLPEDHKCVGLDKRNIFLNLGDEKEDKKISASQRSSEHIHREYKNDFSRFIKRLYGKFIWWLNDRSHRKYRNWHKIIMSAVWIVIISIIIGIIWTNLSKLNEVFLLGTISLFVAVFFWVKYVLRFFRKITRWYEGERNWVKYLIVILILILLWQGYQNRETIFDPAIEYYKRLNFTTLFPSSFNTNFTLLSNPNRINGYTNPNFPYWSKKPITYKFDGLDKCDSNKTKRVREAFFLIQTETDGIVTFLEDNTNGKLVVRCFDFPNPQGAAGFGGPQFWEDGEIIDATVDLYEIESGYVRCTYPTVEIHEILHGFGFDHTNSQSSIMYFSGGCQRLDKASIECLKNIYSNGVEGSSCRNIPSLKYG